MKEHKEAIIREQAILMMYRNQGKVRVIARILKRFMKCINGRI